MNSQDIHHSLAAGMALDGFAKPFASIYEHPQPRQPIALLTLHADEYDAGDDDGN
jgi:hypothetical protein